ncbi:MAG: alpha,alpha-trehalase [Alphaproteobacteria bacterium]|nr:alpha,alpha-trehalase [Alphaproteobacteria bacterium]
MDHTLATYIKKSWEILRRSPLDIAPDPKVDGKRAFLYVPRSEDIDDIKRRVTARKQATGDKTPIDVRYLPDDAGDIKEHGILYLPHDYVVPGGRFNEMYGWDSYWIAIGLMRDGHAATARGMVKNLCYEIENYGGKILNANRTYYLSRSQPPLLGPMAMEAATGLNGQDRRGFLTRAEAALAVNYTTFWKAQRYTEKTGLFHYGNADQAALGPCPEVVFSERNGEAQSHYEIIAAHLRALPVDDPLRRRFYDDASAGLTGDAFAGDRGVRESGFDPSMHMGFYGLETLDFNPVCLNSLLYMQAQILADINTELGRPAQAQDWRQEAERLRGQIQRYLWNETAGLFVNYNYVTERPSDFPYLTSAYPLWAGIATRAQAQSFRKNLNRFETPYGIKSTDRVTGCQWDGPYMWAPLVYFVVAGLRQYGFAADAARIGRNYIDTVARVFREHGTVYEKFNADQGNHNVKAINAGYQDNVTGFGWTNGTVSRLADWAQASESGHPWMAGLGKIKGWMSTKLTQISYYLSNN